METTITREQALELLLKYNKDTFHLEHALTVELSLIHISEPTRPY